MLRLASDADVHGAIIDGLRRHQPGIDLVRAQDSLPEGTPDSAVLAWVAAENRILITNDRNTMVGLAYKRVAAGEPVPGLIATTNKQSIGSAIEDIILLAECMPEEEIRNQVVEAVSKPTFLPNFSCLRRSFETASSVSPFTLMRRLPGRLHTPLAMFTRAAGNHV